MLFHSDSKLFDRHRFREIAGLVHVAAAFDGHGAREQLQGHAGRDGRESCIEYGGQGLAGFGL